MYPLYHLQNPKFAWLIAFFLFAFVVPAFSADVFRNTSAVSINSTDISSTGIAGNSYSCLVGAQGDSNCSMAFDGIYGNNNDYAAGLGNPNWVQVSFPANRTIGRVMVKGLFNDYGVGKYEVQVWSLAVGGWLTVSNYSGPAGNATNHTFNPATTDKVRISIPAGGGGTGNDYTYLEEADVFEAIIPPGAPSAPQVEWGKTFGYAYDDPGHAVAISSTGGYVIAGSTYGGAESHNGFAVYVNSSGAYQWNGSYDMSSANFDLFYGVETDSDGNFVASGYRHNRPVSTWTYSFLGQKISSANGAKMWGFYGKAYYHIDPDEDKYGYLTKSSDGGYIISGSYNPTTGGRSSSLAVKINSSGDMLWLYNVSAAAGQYFSYTKGVETTGGYILAGYEKSSTNYEGKLSKLNSSGQLQWGVTYGSTGDDTLYSVALTSDGGLIAAGTTTSYGSGNQLWIVKANSTGAMQWNKTYGGAGTELGYQIRNTSDGNFIIVGFTSSYGGGGNDLWLAKINPSGDMLWNMTLGGAGDELGEDVRQTSDGGYVLAGSYNSTGVVGQHDMWLIKLASELPPPDVTAPTVTLASPASGNKTLSLSTSFTCNAVDSGGLSSITLKIWNSSNALIYSNASAASGTSNSSTWDYTFPSRGNFTWNCLAYDTSSNSAYAASNATITIQKYAKLELIYPANNAGIPRGKNGAEDIMGRVSDNMSILALITDNETGAPIPGANCGLSIDSSPKGTATANSSGNCIFSYNKSADTIGTHQISFNISSISADYVPSAESVNSSYNLENWTMRVDINNYRTGAGSYYYAGDLSLVNITVKRNSQPANITGIWLVMTDQMDGVLSELSMGSFTQVSTGVYQTELLVPDDVEWLRWKSVVGAPFPGQDSNATSNQHTDITVNQPPSAPLNFSLVGSSGAPLENSQITIYRQGALGQQAIFNQTLGSGTGSVQKSIIQNDSGYDLEIRTPNSNSIMISNFNLSAGLNFATQQANFTGPAPNQTRLMSAVLASNATNFLKSTLTFAKTFEPDRICMCQNWNFSSSSCGGAWVCNSTSAYEYSSNSTHFWFNVTHFTGYAIGQSENENLTIWDETDPGMPYGNQIRYISQNTRFFANYSNSSSAPITGADCSIWFSDSGWSAMGYNSTNLYEYTRVFASGGSFGWNVSCNKTGQATLNATDTVLVNSTIAVILNSPADGSTQKNSVISYNWTPYGFPGDPSCNLTRNGSLVHISSCTNNEPCTFANTTANGYYIWNITCNSGATTRESPTRTLTVNTLSHSTAAEGILNMNITEISSISLPQNTISFGTVEITQTYDSYPGQFFVIKNDGNTIVDIEVNATNPFLSTNCSSLPCSAYQVKVGANETTPYPSCSANPSKETYANMYGSSSGLLINDFNFVDNDDSANIYIKFRLPNDEPPGSKASTVTFWAKSSGSYACD